MHILAICLLVVLHNSLVRALDEKHVSPLFLLDLTAAFDTVDHSILLSILEHRFCIRGLALDWFKSYFSDRTQTVMHSDQTTCSFPVNISVPQGSMFGPLGFAAYTEDVDDVINRHSVLFQLYADDTQLHASSRPDDFSSLCVNGSTAASPTSRSGAPRDISS